MTLKAMLTILSVTDTGLGLLPLLFLQSVAVRESKTVLMKQQWLKT